MSKMMYSYRKHDCTFILFVPMAVFDLHPICRFTRTLTPCAGRSRERVGDETVHEFFKEEAILVAISSELLVTRDFCQVARKMLKFFYKTQADTHLKACISRHRRRANRVPRFYSMVGCGRAGEQKDSVKPL